MERSHQTRFILNSAFLIKQLLIKISVGDRYTYQDQTVIRNFKIKTYIVENKIAGIANNALPNQIAKMIPATTYFDVRIFRGQTMALYLKNRG